MALDKVKSALAASGQDHLLTYYEGLEEKKQVQFLEHLDGIDFQEAKRLFKKAKDSLNSEAEKLDDRMKPIPPTQFESEVGVDNKKFEEYRMKGLEEISNNNVAVILLAGGQGTRLGVSYPKGMYSVDLPSGKTLFQIQAERIKRVTTLAKEATGKLGRIPWYIMTSGPTNETTKKYLKANNYFGLNEEDVIIFQQGLLPCFDMDGKIFLDEKDKVALAPDGNGGIYRALEESGALSDMEKRGVKYVHVHSVDNILVKVADPVFIGYCVKKEADCGAKVVRKSSPTEAVGVICQVDGLFQVVEYSEITDKTAHLTNPDGELVFSAGNICNHFFKTEFLREIANKHEKELKLHVAIKKIPFVNKEGERVKPSATNGIKIEKFIFDVFQFTNKFVTWEVPRKTEFSALKNADAAGKDCPSTARKDLLSLHKMYIENAGGKIESGEVEISPALSYAGENLERIVKGVTYNSGKIVVLDGSQEISVNGAH